MSARDKLIGYKGFDRDMKCRGMQYEVGKTYTHEGVLKLCESGLHWCEYPLDVLTYYPPGESEYAIVVADGTTDEREKDSKRVSQSLTVKAKIGIAGLVEAAVEWTAARAGDNIAKGDYSRAASSGNSSSAASSGDCSRAASSGNSSSAASSGYYSRAASSGDCSSAASSGEKTIAMVAGYAGRAMAGPDGAIALAWYDGKRPRITVGYVGEGIEADTWYRCDDAGKLVRA